MLGGYISDLEAGDVFKPFDYVLTPFMCSVYADGVQESCEWFHSALSPAGRQIRPPCMMHADKMHMLETNCLKERRIAGDMGPHARIHYEYHARHHSAAFVGERLIVSGRITDKYESRGRTYIRYEMEVRTADGRLITSYFDRTLLKYAVEKEAGK